MFKKALLYSVMLGLMTSNPVFAQYGQIARPATKAVKTVKMTPRQAMYHYAKTGNIKGLQQLKAQGHNIELLDAKGQSALCEAVWKKDKTAVSTLIQIGANQNSSCMNKIPQNYKNAAGLQSYSSAVASSNGAGIAAVAGTSAGLSTGAKVAIGVGAVALVGGGIALAAGGGGGSKHADNPCPSGVFDDNGNCVAGDINNDRIIIDNNTDGDVYAMVNKNGSDMYNAYAYMVYFLNLL